MSGIRFIIIAFLLVGIVPVTCAQELAMPDQIGKTIIDFIGERETIVIVGTHASLAEKSILDFYLESSPQLSGIETVDEAVCLADIVRAKVIDDKTIPLQGSLIGSQLGVILANCSRCGSQLDKIGRNKLKCKECSYFEKRKTTIDYGSGKLAFKT